MILVDDVAAKLDRGDLAVFDADGTLWANDVGEGFQAALIAEGVLSPAVDVEYLRLVKTDFAAAYTYATQALAGLREDMVRERGARFFESDFAPLIFPDMRALVRALHVRGVDVHIASASNRWVVEAGASHFDIPPNRVHAMTVAVRRGVVTGELVPPAVTRDGKAQLIKERLGGAPALVAGNSVNDLPMMRLATRVALAVNAESGADPKTGEDLAAEAKARGWTMWTVNVGG